MFSSYGGVSSRSKSTTDIFRASSELDDASYPPASGYMTLRKNTNPPSIVNRRRRLGPVPPQRSDSFIVDPKRVRSHDVVRREPDPGNTVTVKPTQLTQSPGSQNFVKKLVATLERRQREQKLGIGGQSCAVDLENELLHKKSYKEARNTVPGTGRQEFSEEQTCIARFNSELIYSRVQPTQLEDLEEHEDEDDDEWYDTNDLTSQYWEPNDHQEIPNRTAHLPIHIIERSNDNNNNPPKATVRRTIKNMLSSFLNWKNGKSLPKGSREYYAARESLGEEMRVFRRDTMPRLMEQHPKIKGRKHHRSNERACPTRDDQREFSELIGSPKSLTDDSMMQSSIATIHPVYGSSKAAIVQQQRLSWYNHEFPDVDEKPETVYGSIKVKPPTPPPRAVVESPPPLEHLIRPSKVKDMQKGLSSRQSESYGSVQLRRPLAPSKNNNNNNRNSIVYDVPRSNRRVDDPPAPGDRFDDTVIILADDRAHNRFATPEYANVSGIIAAHDDDKRLHCTAFTTF